MPNSWTKYAAQTRKLEKQYTPKLIGVIKAFRSKFIQDLQSHGRSTAISNLHKVSFAEQLTPTISSLYKSGATLGIKLQWPVLRQAEAEAQRMLRREQKAAGFGRNDVWIREVLNFLKLHMLEILQDMTDTMREDILKILQKGVDDNLTIPEIVRELKAEGLIQSRAQVIARTEINKATNAGHKIAAQSTSFEVDKGWSAANDERTRPGHRDVNGQRIGENDLFNVPVYRGKIRLGTEEMDGPGDPNASVGNLANCRCRVLYFPKRDANGRLILRDRSQAPVIPMRRPSQFVQQDIAAQLKSAVTIGVEIK